MKSTKIISTLEKVLDMKALTLEEVGILEKHVEILKADFDLVDQIVIAEDRTLVLTDSPSDVFGRVFRLQSGDLMEQWRKKSN